MPDLQLPSVYKIGHCAIVLWGVNSIKIKTLVGLRLNTTYKLIKGDLRTDAKGRIPGLVVMGDNSCLKGCGFESQHHILDEHDIFCIDFCKKCIVCSKETENKQKEAGVGPFKKDAYAPSLKSNTEKMK